MLQTIENFQNEVLGGILGIDAMDNSRTIPAYVYEIVILLQQVSY